MPASRITMKAAALVSAAVLMCTSLAACAPKNASSTQSSSKAGTVTVGLPGSLSTLDTAHETGIINYYVAQVTSEGLLAVDKDGKLVPAIATAYHTDDAKTWVFQIRQDAKFQDGNPVTIEDVLFSINVAKDPEKSPSSAVYWTAGIEAAQTGEWEITITLPSPAENFGWTVTANGGLWITEKSFYEAAQSYGSSKDLIMGTGPYKATSFQPDSKAVFEKSGTWWGGDTPAQTIEFDFFSDENSRLLAQQSGQIDISTQLPTDQLSQFESINGVKVLTESDRSFVGLTFDEGVAPFDDIHVRKAIAHAVDRKAIVDSILKGRGATAFVIDMGLFNLLQHGPLGVLAGHANTANAVAASIATIYSWIMNRVWTYRGRTQENAGREAFLFFFANLCGIGITQFCLLFSHHILGLTSPLADNISAYVVGFALGTAFRFVFYHYVVFTGNSTK